MSKSSVLKPQGACTKATGSWPLASSAQCPGPHGCGRSPGVHRACGRCQAVPLACERLMQNPFSKQVTAQAVRIQCCSWGGWRHLRAALQGGRAGGKDPSAWREAAGPPADTPPGKDRAVPHRLQTQPLWRAGSDDVLTTGAAHPVPTDTRPAPTSTRGHTVPDVAPAGRSADVSSCSSEVPSPECQEPYVSLGDPQKEEHPLLCPWP